MARAGLATARLVLALAPHAERVLVLAGPGNNGGDGLIAAFHLKAQGKSVRVVHLADPARLPADAAQALQQARHAGVPVTAALQGLDEPDLVIDALLGLGAARPPEGDLARAIDMANAGQAPILAIDLPSGLHPDTGSPVGSAAIHAAWTLSLLTLKPGLFTGQGRDHAGDPWFDVLGVTETETPCAWLGPWAKAPQPDLPSRRHAQHKGSFGDLMVIGGAAGMTGAAALAGRAALTAGAGRVYLSLLDDAEHRSPMPELMLRKAAWLADARTLSATTVVCGCGGGPPVADTLAPLLIGAGRLLLDADALNAVARDTGLQKLLADRAARGQPTVLTPHPLEAARLLGVSAAEVQADRLAAAARLSQRLAAVVALKGSGTVVAAPGHTPWINASGNAALATAGSGDVLAGWIGGLWAQWPPSNSMTNLTLASACARHATWLHGHAADRHAFDARGQVRTSPLPLRAGDLIEAMAAALG